MKYNYVMFAVCNVILSIILGIYYGLVGVYAATSISRLMTVELKEGRVVFEQILGLKYIDYIKQYFGSLILVSLASTIAMFLTNLVALSGWIGLILKGIVCAISVNIFFWMIFRNTLEYKNMRKRMLQLISSK